MLEEKPIRKVSVVIPVYNEERRQRDLRIAFTVIFVRMRGAEMQAGADVMDFQLLDMHDDDVTRVIAALRHLAGA
jgi:hypothetical protein